MQHSSIAVSELKQGKLKGAGGNNLFSLQPQSTGTIEQSEGSPRVSSSIRIDCANTLGCTSLLAETAVPRRLCCASAHVVEETVGSLFFCKEGETCGFDAVVSTYAVVCPKNRNDHSHHLLVRYDLKRPVLLRAQGARKEFSCCNT